MSSPRRRFWPGDLTPLQGHSASCILREGMNVKGINTAATLWCSAAVGALAGGGFPLQGLLGTGKILLLNIGLRPVSHWIDRRLKTAADIEMYYQMHASPRQMIL